MKQTEVTHAEYRTVRRSLPTAPSFQQADDHPVVSVTWTEAAAYCESTGGRLASEEEWEYAARAGDSRASAMATWIGLHGMARSRAKPHIRSPRNRQNAWNLYDMLGNVWEWCSDWYEPNYDPEKSDKKYRVLRGGSWNNDPKERSCVGP